MNKTDMPSSHQPQEGPSGPPDPLAAPARAPPAATSTKPPAQGLVPASATLGLPASPQFLGTFRIVCTSPTKTADGSWSHGLFHTKMLHN